MVTTTRCVVGKWVICILLKCFLVTARRQSLRQGNIGNIFTSVCHSFCPQGRAVRILLECILVKKYCHLVFCSFMVIEIFDESKNVLPYYHSGANFPFNFNLQQINKTCDGLCIKGLVDSWIANIPEGKWSNWVVSQSVCLYQGSGGQVDL